MNVELLKLLLPSSPVLEVTGQSHNCMTSEDVNTLMGYSGLTETEYMFVINKYLDSEQGLNSKFYKIIKQEILELLDNKNILKRNKVHYANKTPIKIGKLLKMAIIEVTVDKCFVCSGTGFLINLNNISTCPHCKNGIFNYTDDVRKNILKVKTNDYLKFKKIYLEILDYVKNLEISALDKLDKMKI